MNISEGMGTTPEYEWLVIILSSFCLALASIYLWRATKAYQRWHDERAAVGLGSAVGIVVITFGFLISGLGLPLESPTLSIAGMSIARGATVVLLGTILLADVHRHDERG